MLTTRQPYHGLAKPSNPSLPMPPDHPSLIEEEVFAHSGWHPRYARVLAVGNDGDYGFAVVDGRTGDQFGDAYLAYGCAPAGQSITISFEGRLHDVLVSRHGVWAFIKSAPARPAADSFPDSLTATRGYPRSHSQPSASGPAGRVKGHGRHESPGADR